MGGNGFFTFTDRKIVGANGSDFIFMGLKTNPDSVKSTEGIDIAWIEEANKASKRSIDLLIPTLRKEGSELWGSFNRHLTTDPIDDMFLGSGGGRPDSFVEQINYWDNPWFPDTLRAELEWDKARDLDRYLHIWEGQPLLRTDARVFNNWSEGDLDHLVNETQATARFGADWGGRDPSVLVKLYVWPERKLIYFSDEAYKVAAKIDELPSLFAGTDARDPKDRRWQNPFGHRGVPGAMRAKIVADSSRPDMITHLRDRGFGMVAARKGNNSVEEGIEWMQSYDIVVNADRCPYVLQELTLYAYKIDPQTDEVTNVLSDKNNHVIDASRYALEADRRNAARPAQTGGFPELIESEL